jgi:hypothetical protein
LQYLTAKQNISKGNKYFEWICMVMLGNVLNAVWVPI